MSDIETMVAKYINANGIKEYRYQIKPFVGMKLPDYVGYQDAVQFDIDDFGAFLRIAYNKPTEKELAEFRNGEREVRLIGVENAMWFTFRFGTLDWMDAPYTPFLSKKLHFDVAKIAGLCRKITVVLIDTSDGTVVYVDEIQLDGAFADSMFRMVYRIKSPGAEFDKTAYDKLLATVVNLYSPNEIAAQSKIKCRIAK